MASITKNTVFMTIASIFQKIISFIYFALIARTLGVEATGRYAFALAFTTIFVVFVDLGFTNVLVREAAKLKEKIQAYFSTVLYVKLFFGLISYIGVVAAINFMGYSAETRHLVYLSAITMLFDSLHLTIYGALRAIGDLKYEAAGIIGSQILTLILGSVFLFFNYPVIFLIGAFTVSSFINVCFSAIVLREKYKISLRPKYNAVIFRYLGRITIPFALAAVFARVYSYIDSVLLSKLIGDSAVGIYSVPYKITYAFQFVPLALIAAIYPRFSEYFARDKKKLSLVFQQGIKYLMVVVSPIAVGIGILSRDIIIAFFTDKYLDSVVPLKILLASLVFSYISFPVGAFLNACNRQVSQTVIVAITMFLNIILNLILIPTHGVIGASISALCGNILLTLFGYLTAIRIVKVSHKFLFTAALQIMLSALIMGIAVWNVNLSNHFVTAILAGAAVYPAALFITGAVTKKELYGILSLVKKGEPI